MLDPQLFNGLLTPEQYAGARQGPPPEAPQDMAPQPTPPQGGPPMATQQPGMEENKSKWRTFLDKMKTDPNFKAGVMQTGLAMMRSRQPGEGSLDVVSNALQTGIGTVQALRERDRKVKGEEEDRALNKRNVENQIETRTTTANTGAKGVQNEYQRILNQDGQARKAHDLAIAELDEKVRSNKANEKNDATRAGAAAKAAETSGSGSSSADVTKINNLAAQYQAQDMSPTDAKAKATREVMTTGKGSAASVFNQAMDQEIELWQSNFDNMGKAPDPKTLEGMQKRAKERARDVMGLQAEMKPVGPNGDGNIYGSPEERINSLVNQAKAAGATPEQIKQAIINEKADPAKYGYK